MRCLLPAILALMILACPAAVHATARQDSRNYKYEEVFRHFVWGASMEDVKKFEPAHTMDELPGQLVFIEQPDLFRRLITYDFRGNKLWRGKYEYVELTEPDTQKVMDRFLDIEGGLIAQFGQPTRREMLWKDDTYRYYPEFWNRALFAENLRFRSTWERGVTRIVLQFYHEDAHYPLFYTVEDMRVSGMPKNDSYLNLFPDDPTSAGKP